MTAHKLVYIYIYTCMFIAEINYGIRFQAYHTIYSSASAHVLNIDCPYVNVDFF